MELLWICFSLLLLTVSIDRSTASCVWYDNCYHDPETNADKPCPYFLSPKPLEDIRAANYLTRRCPAIFQKGDNGKLSTCCSPRQIRNLKVIFDRLQEVAGHCPSCFSNIANLFCGFTCGLNQDLFMSGLEVSEPSDSVEFELPDDPTAAAIMRRRHPFASIRPHDTCSTHSYISAVTSVRVDNTTVNAIVKSCANVRYRGKRVFDQIILMPMTVQSLFNYIGNPDINRNVAVRLGFQAVSDGKPALSFRTYACNEVEPTKNRSCLCEDCPATCPLYAPLPVAAAIVGEKNSDLFGYSPSKSDLLLITVVGLSGFAAICLLFLLACRIYGDNSGHMMADKTAADDVVNPTTFYQTPPSSTILVEHRRIDTSNNNAVVFTALNDSYYYVDDHQKPGFWQRLGSKYWARYDFSMFNYPRQNNGADQNN